jgi:hypothetical protein
MWYCFWLLLFWVPFANLNPYPVSYAHVLLALKTPLYREDKITDKIKKIAMYQFRLGKGKILIICLEDSSLQ